jgi:predicted NodU family carbamoyl transferase
LRWILKDAVGAAGAADFVAIHYTCPFIVMAFPVRAGKEALFPGFARADGTGRLQTAETDVNPVHWRLFGRFGDGTRVPV